jgi:RecA-family ATPase
MALETDMPPYPPTEAYDEPQGRVFPFPKNSKVHSTVPPAANSVPFEAYDIQPASTWADRDAPPPRDWIMEDLLIGAGRVTSFMANGGVGKTTIAIQLAVATALSRPLFGKEVRGGAVVGFFCEDEQDEIERRVRAECAASSTVLESLDKLHLVSRDGDDNMLCTFDHDLIVLTDHYWRVDATLAAIKPRLTIIDTAADVFAGDFMSTPHVRQFIKVALGGFCKRHGTGVLLIAHPSSSGMASGDGGGFSVAWNNSVRCRLYLRRPKSEDAEAAADRRVLEIKKANYGPSGAMIPLIYDRGGFILDPEPIEEGARPVRAPKADTRLAMAVMAYFDEKASSGQVVTFKTLFEAMQTQAEIPQGDYQKVRKPLQRTLKGLVNEQLLMDSNVPRGYRHRGHAVNLMQRGAE